MNQKKTLPSFSLSYNRKESIERKLKRKRRGFDELIRSGQVTEPYKTRKKAEYSRLYKIKRSHWSSILSKLLPEQEHIPETTELMQVSASLPWTILYQTKRGQNLRPNMAYTYNAIYLHAEHKQKISALK